MTEWSTVIYIPICLYFNEKTAQTSKTNYLVYIPICLYFNESLINYSTFVKTFTVQYVSILIYSFSLKLIFCFCVYIPICLYFNLNISRKRRNYYAFTFQYVSILIHRPNSLFFSNLFPHFLLTSQSLQIFYHISFINSTKEKQNHLFFMFVEFCRCMGIFTLSEVDSLKIVVME